MMQRASIGIPVLHRVIYVEGSIIDIAYTLFEFVTTSSLFCFSSCQTKLGPHHQAIIIIREEVVVKSSYEHGVGD